jgi:YfiH family protein
MLLHSELLRAAGFAHGFSTRAGGVSEGPFESLNLARSVGDELAAVDENLRRFLAAARIDGTPLFTVSQVHGAEVITVGRAQDPTAIRGKEADALVGAEAGVAVSVRTADCLPVLVADPDTGRVAAIHAGWRGVVAGVVRSGVAALGPGPRAIAAIGPGIGPCCFEVGPDVASSIAASAPGADVIRTGKERPHVDLAAAVVAQLAASGVHRIDRVPACTMCDPARFFSFRRDGKRSGRMLSAIAATPPT